MAMGKDKLKALLVGFKPSTSKPSLGSSEPEDDDTDVDADERTSMARSIIQAIKMNDPETLDLALEEHYRACSGSSDTDVDAEEDDAGYDSEED